VTFTATAANRVSDSDAVDIPAVDRDTVTPIIVALQDNPTSTTVDFIVSGVNPTGGTAPTLTGLLLGTDGVNASVPVNVFDGVAFSINQGQTVRVNRAAFGTTAQVTATFTATLGTASAKVVRTILNLVKTTFGPSLTLTPSIGTTTASIAYTGTFDTLEMQIDTGSWTTAGASPITGITLDSSPHSYNFRATKDGQTVPGNVAIPALAVNGGYQNRFGGVGLSGNDSTNQLTVVWSFSGDPSSTFRVLSSGDDASATGVEPTEIETESASSGYSYASHYDLLPSGGAGAIMFRVRVEAVVSGSVVATGVTSHSHRVFAI
jgi:hypothetical protein